MVGGYAAALLLGALYLVAHMLFAWPQQWRRGRTAGKRPAKRLLGLMGDLIITILSMLLPYVTIDMIWNLIPVIPAVVMAIVALILTIISTGYAIRAGRRGRRSRMWTLLSAAAGWMMALCMVAIVL